jgi:hypothetical protein
VRTSVNHEEAIKAPPSLAQGGSVFFSAKENKQLVDTWRKGLSGFDPSADKQIGDCLFYLEDLSLKEKDKAQWIMDSEKLRNWLAQTQSRVIEIRAETAPEELINSMSLTTSVLSVTLSSLTDYGVLSFFCGLKRHESYNEDDCSPMAILNSLNGQLLQFVLQKRPTVNLAMLESHKYFRGSREKPKYASALFKELLSLLPENDVVFILLDSFSRISGDKAQSDKIIEMICQAIEDMPDLIIKLLVTDSLPNCPIADLADLSIYVPNEIDGWQCGINMDLLELKTTTLIKQLQVPQRQDPISQNSSDESDEEDW